MREDQDAEVAQHIRQAPDEQRLRDRKISDDVFITIGVLLSFMVFSHLLRILFDDRIHAGVVVLTSWFVAKYIKNRNSYYLSISTILIIFVFHLYMLISSISLGIFIYQNKFIVILNFTIALITIVVYSIRFGLTYNNPILLLSAIILFYAIIFSAFPNFAYRNIDSVIGLSFIIVFMIGVAIDLQNKSCELEHKIYSIALILLSSPIIFLYIINYIFYNFIFIILLLIIVAISIILNYKYFFISGLFSAAIFALWIVITAGFNAGISLYATIVTIGFLAVLLIKWRQLRSLSFAVLPERFKRQLPRRFVEGPSPRRKKGFWPSL